MLVIPLISSRSILEHRAFLEQQRILLHSQDSTGFHKVPCYTIGMTKASEYF